MSDIENAENPSELSIKEFLRQYAEKPEPERIIVGVFNAALTRIESGLTAKYNRINTIDDLKQATDDFSCFENIKHIGGIGDGDSLTIVKNACLKYAKEHGIEIESQLSIADFLDQYAPNQIGEQAVDKQILKKLINDLDSNSIFNVKQLYENSEKITKVRGDLQKKILVSAMESYESQNLEIVSKDVAVDLTPDLPIAEFINRFADTGDKAKAVIISSLEKNGVLTLKDLFEKTEGGTDFNTPAFKSVDRSQAVRNIIEDAYNEYIEQGGKVAEYKSGEKLDIESFLYKYADGFDDKTIGTAARKLQSIAVFDSDYLSRLTDGFTDTKTNLLSHNIKKGTKNREVLESACGNYLARDLVKGLMPNITENVLKSVVAKKPDGKGKGCIIDFGGKENLCSVFSGKLEAVIKIQKIEGGELSFEGNKVFIPEELLKNLREILPELKQENSRQKG